MSLRTGIVGLGYVGGALRKGFELHNVPIETYDLNENTNPSQKTLQSLTEVSDIIYVCVPTPMKFSGECDTSIVESVVSDICVSASTPKIIVIKSTVPPGTTERLQEKTQTHTVLFSPEFLTEANYLNDFLNQELMLVGKPKGIVSNFAWLALENQQSATDFVKSSMVVDATTAELFKYLANVFLSVKVSFANEMAVLAEKLGVDWEDMRSLILHDSRLGNSHWKVPGPDGHRGFGGTCFPKDTSALIHHAKQLGLNVPVVESAWNRNISIDRPEKDWEQLKGRAVKN